MVVKPLGIREFVGMVEEPGFCFARYGDGTFFSLQGIEGTNCDGAKTSILQAPLLEASIRDTSITHGIGDLAVSEAKAGEWLDRNDIDIEWYDCNVMHTASIKGKLYPLIALLRKRKTVLLGPPHLSQLRKIPLLAYLSVHPTKAFDEVDRLEKAAFRTVQKFQANTVLISAGPAAPVLVSRLHLLLPSVNIIDTGSLWDPYVGKYSRKVFKKLGRAGIRALTLVNFK